MLANRFEKFVECNYDEAKLWSQLRLGEKVGMERLYLKFSNELFRYGMAIKPNRSFVKDCIQELFIDLWKYKDTLKHTDNVKLYLFRSLSNKIGKEIAKEKRLILDCEISNVKSVQLENSFEYSWIEGQQEEEIQLKLKKGLTMLPARQREVINLLFFEKHSYEVISEILGINVESSYTLAWKAIKNLKKYFLIVDRF